MLKKAYLFLILLLTFHISFSQTTFLQIESEDMHVLDRLETMSGRLSDTIYNGDKPESRKNAVYFLEYVLAQQKPDTAKGVNTDHAAPAPRLSKIDQYNVAQMISENGEWVPKGNGAIRSEHSWFNTFYTKQYDFGYIKSYDDFFVVVNPVLSGIAMYQHNTSTPSGIPDKLFTNSQGAELRGWIAKKVGFYTSITDNQEQFPYFINNMVTNPSRQAVPGADYFLLPGIATASTGRYDYMQASGYINFDVVKHINLSFGSGKHFIGDGISSLFLTDYSSNMPFLQLQTRLWHINYECLYLELTPQYNKNLGDTLLTHKYSTMHYLNWNVTRWLDLGFFEAEVFDRPNVYEVSYLNPIIFSTAVNRFNGEGDKSILGMSAKMLVARHFQFYGQLMLDEFRAKDLFSNDGWYGNKWGIQAGGKYFDAFNLKNLDLQGEFMAVRPYSYAAKDTFDNYTNYNQPLADPLGSGFIRGVGLIKYQPVKNIYLSLKGTYYVQGMDNNNVNLGNNIFDPYVTAPEIYGVKMINGPESHCKMLSLNLSYQLRRNLFIDGGGTYRKYTNSTATLTNPEYSTTGPVYGSLTTNYFYVGIRLNAVRRDYDFF